jgi:hypothetical protein
LTAPTVDPAALSGSVIGLAKAPPEVLEPCEKEAVAKKREIKSRESVGEKNVFMLQ